MSGATPSIQAPGFLAPVLTQFDPTIALTKSFLVPRLSGLISKIQAIWQAVLPYLTAVARFATSTLGVSLGLLGASFVPLQWARATDDKVLSTALIAAGILIAGAGGYFLCSSGAISSAISSL